MRLDLQRTLKKSIELKGVGVHSGQPATVTLKPARPNQGVNFVRTDLPEQPMIAAHYKNVSGTQMATTLSQGAAKIATVEHLLSAIHGMKIDNLTIEVDGPEVPILDGSSAVFCQAIQDVGCETQLQARPYLFLKRKVEVKVGEKWAVVEPSDRLEVHASIEWDHPAIGFQEFHYIEGQTDYSEVASARTFGFLHEIEALKKMGLARGGSLENAVVLDSAMVLNPDGLRYPDEFVRHKVLDALGDFQLAGIAIRASFRLHRAGHDLHWQMIQQILKDESQFEIRTSGGNEGESSRKLAGLRAALARAGFAATF